MEFQDIQAKFIHFRTLKQKVKISGKEGGLYYMFKLGENKAIPHHRKTTYKVKS